MSRHLTHPFPITFVHGPLQMLLTFISTPLLALGLRTETQTLVVNFFDRFQVIVSPFLSTTKLFGANTSSPLSEYMLKAS